MKLLNKGKALAGSALILLPALACIGLWGRLPGTNDPAKLAFCLGAPAAMLTTHWLCLLLTFHTNRRNGQSKKALELVYWLLPAIFFSTVLTHLGGGSAGREGAALQMGGTIGYHTGHLFGLDDRDMRTATMTGMAAFFSALFGTPLTATIFAIVVISIGVMYHAALIPCLTASLVAYWISVEMGVEPTRFLVEAPALEGWTLLSTGRSTSSSAAFPIPGCGW